VDNDRPEIVELLWERGLPTLFRLYEQIALADDKSATDCLMNLLFVLRSSILRAETEKIIEAAENR